MTCCEHNKNDRSIHLVKNQDLTTVYIRSRRQKPLRLAEAAEIVARWTNTPTDDRGLLDSTTGVKNLFQIPSQPVVEELEVGVGLHGNLMLRYEKANRTY